MVVLLLVPVAVVAAVALARDALVVSFSAARSISSAVLVPVFSVGRIAVVCAWGGLPLWVAVMWPFFARVAGRPGILTQSFDLIFKLLDFGGVCSFRRGW